MHACGFSSLIRFSSQPSKKKWLGGSKPNIMWKYSDIFTYITSARAPIEPNSSLAVGSEPQTDPVLSNSSLRWGDKLARAIIQVASFTDRSSTAAEPLLCFVCMLPKMIRTTSKVGLRLFLSSSLKQWGASTSCSFRHCLLYAVCTSKESSEVHAGDEMYLELKLKTYHELLHISIEVFNWQFCWTKKKVPLVLVYNGQS